MALPTLSNAPTLIDAADATTNWTGSTLTAGGTGDITIDGSGSIAAICRANNSELSTSGWTGFTASTAGHLRGWFQFFSLGNLNYFDLGLNSGAATFQLFSGPPAQYTGGLTLKDNTLGGWFYVLIDLSGTPDTGTIPTTITSIEYIFRRDSQPRNALNTFADALHYGDGYTVTGGTSGDPVTFLTIAAQDITDGAYGIVQNIKDTVYCFGAITLGNGATATYVEVKTTALLFDTQRLAATNLYSITATGSGCTLDMQNSLVRGQSGDIGSETFDFDVQNVGTLIFDTNTLVRAGTTTFGSGQTIDSSTFDVCGTVITNGATINNSSFIGTTAQQAVEVTSTTVDNINNCSFTGDGTSHAVKLTDTINTNTTINWNSTFDASTYASVNATGAGSAGDSEVLLVNVNTGSTLTINVLNGVASPTYRNEGGGSVVVVSTRLLTVSNIESDTELRIYTYTDINDPTTYTELVGGENIGTSNGGFTVSSDPDNTGKLRAQYNYDISGGNINTVLVAHNVNFEFFRSSLILDSTQATTFKLFQVADRQYF